jgi:hypothetical protein
MLENRFTVISKASIRPNKIVFYNQFIRNDHFVCSDNSDNGSLSPDDDKQLQVKAMSLPVCNLHGFNLSVKATARIKEKISWLYELAKNKTIVTKNNKTLHSYKMNFITLTLPAVQEHSTQEITSSCLNQFLIECKLKYNMLNYVWRLEFQKNGNVHYHIATDTFIDYTDCKLIWNRCIAKLGYIRRYQEKFTNMTYSDYARNYSNGGKINAPKLRERYGRGVATRWDSPNTIDVRAVNNAKNIASYISKYITKNDGCPVSDIVSNREPATTNLRLWFCSRSLSALDKITIFIDEIDDTIDAIFNNLSNIKRYFLDYVSLWFWNKKDQSNSCLAALYKLFHSYAHERDYIPA